MVIVGQGSQERVSVLWECSPCKTLVVDQYLSTMRNSSKKKNKLSYKSIQKGEELVTPMPSIHLSPCPTIVPFCQAQWKKGKTNFSTDAVQGSIPKWNIYS